MVLESLPRAEPEVLKKLQDPVVIDARDQSEIDGLKGGPSVEGSSPPPSRTWMASAYIYTYTLAWSYIPYIYLYIHTCIYCIHTSSDINGPHSYGGQMFFRLDRGQLPSPHQQRGQVPYSGSISILSRRFREIIHRRYVKSASFTRSSNTCFGAGYRDNNGKLTSNAKSVTRTITKMIWIHVWSILLCYWVNAGSIGPLGRWASTNYKPSML